MQRDKIDYLLESFQARYMEEGVKEHLGNNWGKYLGGAGAAAGAAGLADMGDAPSHVSDYLDAGANGDMGDTMTHIGNTIKGNASEFAGQTGDAISGAVNSVGDAASKFADNVTSRSPFENYNMASGGAHGIEAAGKHLGNDQLSDPGVVDSLKSMYANQEKGEAGLGAQAAAAGLGAAGLGAAGYGAKKLKDRYGQR